MSTFRVRKTIDSETLYLPELKPLLGRTVEISVTEISDTASPGEAADGPASDRAATVTHPASQAILKAIAEVERIQQGMQPKDDPNPLIYLRDARSGD